MNERKKMTLIAKRNNLVINMKKLTNITLPIVLIIALILLANPYMFWMPTPLYMGILIVFILTFVLFGTFLWQEKAADERENLHRFIIGRFAFLAITTVLFVGIIIQTLQHSLDIWLVTALVIGILAKVIGGIYLRNRY